MILKIAKDHTFPHDRLRISESMGCSDWKVSEITETTDRLEQGYPNFSDPRSTFQVATLMRSTNHILSYSYM